MVSPAGPTEKVALLPCATRSPRNASPVCLHSPHPVKPLSTAPVEGSPDRKQSRSSLSTALSSGLEKLKTVTSGSIQPVAPAPQVGQTADAKRLKVRSSRLPGVSDQMCGTRKRCQASRGLGAGEVCQAGWSKKQAWPLVSQVCPVGQSLEAS